MTVTCRLLSVFVAFWSTCAAQTYTISSSTSFAMRIHFNSPSNPQEPRVAGADHSVSKSLRDKVGLKLTEAGGFVIVEGATCALSKADSETLRRGSTVELAGKYQISLSSNAAERSKALLVVQSASSTDHALLEILELRLVSQTTRHAEQAGAGQPATRPESKSEGGDKPQPEAEERSR